MHRGLVRGYNGRVSDCCMPRYMHHTHTHTHTQFNYKNKVLMLRNEIDEEEVYANLYNIQDFESKFDT